MGSARSASISLPACNDGTNKLAHPTIGCCANVDPAQKVTAIRADLLSKNKRQLLAHACLPVANVAVMLSPRVYQELTIK
jgi:hypothetical protein